MYDYRKEGFKVWAEEEYQQEGLNTARYTVLEYREEPLYTWILTSLGMSFSRFEARTLNVKF